MPVEKREVDRRTTWAERGCRRAERAASTSSTSWRAVTTLRDPLRLRRSRFLRRMRN
jgi:hypothetical protein